MWKRRKGARLAGLVTAAAFVLALGACNGVDEAPPVVSPPAVETPTPDAPEETPVAMRVTAALSDFSIELSEESFAPGAYTFVAEQQGENPHALSISGPGVDTASTPVIEPGGEAQELTVNLEQGTYELWCPVGNHRALGMEVEITVE